MAETAFDIVHEIKSRHSTKIEALLYIHMEIVETENWEHGRHSHICTENFVPKNSVFEKRD